jgi:hypothetical protein
MSRIAKICGWAGFCLYFVTIGIAIWIMYHYAPTATVTLVSWQAMTAFLIFFLQGFYFGWLAFRFKWISLRTRKGAEENAEV